MLDRATLGYVDVIAGNGHTITPMYGTCSASLLDFRNYPITAICAVCGLPIETVDLFPNWRHASELPVNIPADHEAIPEPEVIEAIPKFYNQPLPGYDFAGICAVCGNLIISRDYLNTWDHTEKRRA